MFQLLLWCILHQPPWPKLSGTWQSVGKFCKPFTWLCCIYQRIWNLWRRSCKVQHRWDFLMYSRYFLLDAGKCNWLFFFAESSLQEINKCLVEWPHPLLHPTAMCCYSCTKWVSILILVFFFFNGINSF